MSRTFVNAEGKEITVSGGDYGWWLDGATECASIIADIKSLNSTTREPAFRQRADVFADVDFKDDYIEVNLSKQKLYAIKDGKKFDYYFKSDGTMNRKLLEEHRMIYEEEKTKRSNHRNKGKKKKK